jgi:hypothetical protein
LKNNLLESNREQNLNSLKIAGEDFGLGQPMGGRQSPRGKNFLKPGEGKGEGKGGGMGREKKR